ncbi:MAG: hypothetical protein ABIT96_01755, partial [Ferruginibacter sp.]
ILYILAGFNHFRNPETYIKIIPANLGDASMINIVAGIAEIILGVAVCIKPLRRLGAYGIILMLLAFIPAHIYMFSQPFCIGSNCDLQWVLWLRLLIFQPLLIYWAWRVSRTCVA